MSVIRPRRIRVRHVSAVAIFVFLALAIAGVVVLRARPLISPGDGTGSPRELTEKWTKIFDVVGEKKAYALFLRTGNKLTYDQSHQFSHVIGDVLYRRDGIAGIRICTSDFAFGCYHALIANALADKGLSVVGELDGACKQLGDVTGAYMACIHGIGHGTLAYLGDKKLVEALENCPLLQPGHENIAGCYGGVFMEYNYNTVRSLGGASEDLRPMEAGQAEGPCASSIPAEFRNACYYELPSWWVALERNLTGHTADLDPDTIGIVGDRCGKVKVPDLRSICFRGVGNVIAPETGYDAARMRVLCSAMADTTGGEECFHEALKHLLQNESGKAQLRSLCETNTITYPDLCNPGFLN